MKRYLENQVRQDLRKKMVFIGGPRQVGKTTMAKSILANQAGYLNWDIDEDREKILRRQLPATSMIVFDELHKYKRWRNYLKGLFDKSGKSIQFLVTGSARLDYYRYGGDSLQGRYHYLRLHPLSFAELGTYSQDSLMELLQLGGFPEPFYSGSEVEAKRWSKEYRARFVKEEITSLEKIHDLGTLELFVLRLPDLVGSPLSINSLREDLQTSHKTVSRWLDIMERLYGIYRISPFGSPKIRAVKKEQKHYHFDWSLIPNQGSRFENFVASHLLKWVHFEEDAKGRNLELRYFRDIDGREVDFVIMEDQKPIQMIECKWSDTEINHGLVYLKTRFPNVEAWQISAAGKKDYISKDNIRICPAAVFLKNLV